MENLEQRAARAAGIAVAIDYLAYGSTIHAASVGIIVYSAAMLYQLHEPNLREWYKSKVSRKDW